PSRRTTRRRSSARCESQPRLCSWRRESAIGSTRSSPARPRGARGSASSGRPSKAGWCGASRGSTSATTCGSSSCTPTSSAGSSTSRASSPARSRRPRRLADAHELQHGEGQYDGGDEGHKTGPNPRQNADLDDGDAAEDPAEIQDDCCPRGDGGDGTSPGGPEETSRVQHQTSTHDAT